MGRDKNVPAWAKTPAKSGLLELEITKDGGTKSYITVDKKPGYLLGRNGKDCDVVVAHKSASRIHACVAHHSEGQVYLVDLGSVHGTTLNGSIMEPNSQEQLVPGKSSFTIGSCPWTYTLQHASERADTIDEHAASRRRAHAEDRDRHHRRQEHPSAQDYRRSSRPEHGHEWGPQGRHNEPYRQGLAPRTIHEDRYQRGGGRHGGGQERGRGSFYDRRGPPGRHGGGGPFFRSTNRRGRPDYPDRYRPEELERYDPRGSPPLEGEPLTGAERDHQEPKRRRVAELPSTEAASPIRAAADEEGGGGDAEVGERVTRERRKSRHRHRSREHRHRSSRHKADNGEAHPRREGEPRPERQPRDEGADSDAGEPQPARPVRERRSGFGDAPGGAAAAFAAGTAAPMSVAEHKKKLLWGNKAQETQEEKQEAEKVYGANRWDAAHFANEQDKEKFIKLLGVKNPATAAKAAAAGHTEVTEREVLTGDKQEKVLGDVEHHFMQGLRRADGRKVGLGL